MARVLGWQDSSPIMQRNQQAAGRAKFAAQDINLAPGESSGALYAAFHASFCGDLA
jgi:hypothetical protein